MSQTQTRKQKILGDVKRKRRQRAITSITIAVVLIAIIVAAVIFLRPAPNAVPLPDYLSHCVTGQLYHSHPSVTITINGVGVTIPVTIDPGCAQPIHTHTTDGVLHIETDQDRDYSLGDWFLLWGHFENSATRAILNSTQIFGFRTDATHHLTMTVNGQNYTQKPQDYVFLRNAQTGTNTCSPTPPSCVPDSIVLAYGP
jgi:hypothetical protein